MPTNSRKEVPVPHACNSSGHLNPRHNEAEGVRQVGSVLLQRLREPPTRPNLASGWQWSFRKINAQVNLTFERNVVA